MRRVLLRAAPGWPPKAPAAALPEAAAPNEPASFAISVMTERELDGAAVGHLEASDPLAFGVGARTFHMAEENSLSKKVSDRPPMFTVINGRSQRADAACKERAITSLPVPCSPRIKTFASDGGIEDLLQAL